MKIEIKTKNCETCYGCMFDDADTYADTNYNICEMIEEFTGIDCGKDDIIFLPADHVEYLTNENVAVGMTIKGLGVYISNKLKIMYVSQDKRFIVVYDELKNSEKVFYDYSNDNYEIVEE